MVEWHIFLSHNFSVTFRGLDRRSPGGIVSQLAASIVTLPAANRGEEMDFGVRRDFLQEARRGDRAVDGDGQAGTQLVSRTQPVAKSGEPRFQGGNDLTHSRTVYVDFGQAARLISEQRWDEDAGHMNSILWPV
jgi:hypothetical protein